MMFLINQTLKNIKKHLGINIVIALTLFVAYLFFFMICCHVEDGMLGVSSFALKDMDRSIYFYGQARQLQRQASIVGGVERMSYLLHRAILRVRKGKRKYIPMALQIIVGVCLLSLSISLSFSLLKQMWEFSSYMKIPFAGVSTEIGDNSTKITESDLKKLKSLSLENDFTFYKQYLSGEPFTIVFADKDFLTGIMGAESAVDKKLMAGQEVIDILENWTPIDIQLRKFYDPESRMLFGYSLKEITPIKTLDYAAPGLLSAVTYTEGSLQVTSFENVLLFPLEACGELLCQSIIALPITSPDNAKITDDLNKIQSCLLSTHPDNSYKIINFGEEVRRTLSRNEQLASTVAILAGFILVIVFFGLTGPMPLS